MLRAELASVAALHAVTSESLLVDGLEKSAGTQVRSCQDLHLALAASAGHPRRWLEVQSMRKRRQGGV